MLTQIVVKHNDLLYFTADQIAMTDVVCDEAVSEMFKGNMISVYGTRKSASSVIATGESDKKPLFSLIIAPSPVNDGITCIEINTCGSCFVEEVTNVRSYVKTPNSTLGNILTEVLRSGERTPLEIISAALTTVPTPRRFVYCISIPALVMFCTMDVGIKDALVEFRINSSRTAVIPTGRKFDTESTGRGALYGNFNKDKS